MKRTNQKRQVILILSNSTSSVYKFRKEVIAALILNNFQVYVSAPDDGHVDELEKLGTLFINTPINRHGTNPVSELVLLHRYWSLIRKISPDVLITYTIKPNIYGNIAAKGLNIPVISMVPGLGETFIYDSLINDIVKLLYRIAFNKTTHILFLNTEDMEIMRDARLLSGQEQLLTQGEGVNLDEFSQIPYPIGPVVSFLYIGRIMRSKGILELIDATRRLKLEKPGEFTITLIGFQEGDITQEVEKAVRDNIVNYAGLQPDVRPYIRDTHCVILPSYKEGLPVSLLEAGASGRPLIATDVSGCREILDDGKNGFLCIPRDADSLYNSMKAFLELTNDQRINMGAAARHKVETAFNRKVVVETMMEIIYSVTNVGFPEKNKNSNYLR